MPSKTYNQYSHGEFTTLRLRLQSVGAHAASVMCKGEFVSVSKLEILGEAVRFRQLIQSCDPEKTELVTGDFPVMNCKMTSMILVYHFLKLYPDLEIKGCGGARPENRLITHYWIEIEGIGQTWDRHFKNRRV